MDSTLFEDSRFEVRELSSRRVMVVKRLPTEASADELMVSFRAIVQSIRPEHRGWGLLFDLRAVIGRSDPEFERSSADVRRVANETFGRVVTLVRTQAGSLQTQRLAREERRKVIVSFDYDEALALASGERA